MEIDEYVSKLKTHHPDIFNALPLPESLQKKWGIPAPSTEIVSLNTFLTHFLKLQNIHCDEKEEKKVCEVTKTE